MTNIIQSDIFRIKKGAAVRNVFLAGMIIIVITGVNMLGSSSGFGGVGVQSTASAARSLPGNGAEFVQQMRDDGLFPFFILAFAVAVLGAEYSTGTIRNSLSYFVDRKKIYFAKCITGLLCCLTYTLLCLVVSFVAGTILFGFWRFQPHSSHENFGSDNLIRSVVYRDDRYRQWTDCFYQENKYHHCNLFNRFDCLSIPHLSNLSAISES